MKYAWIIALAFFLFVTIFFQKSGMIGWVASALSFMVFLYFYIVYGDDGEAVKSEEAKGEEEKEEVGETEIDTPQEEEEEEEVGIEMEQHFAIDPKEFLQACYKNDITEVRRIVEDGFDIETTNHQGVTALMFAVKGRAYEVVRYLIENEADVTSVSEKGTTALKIAQEIEDEKMMEILQ